MSFAPGQKVWLSTKNIAGYSNKLSAKWIGPFDVIEQRGPVSYKLALPEAMKDVHPVFHSSLLQLDTNDPLPGQKFPEPPPPEPDMAAEDEYEVDEVLDIRKMHGGLKAQIKWTGWDEDYEWYPVENLENAPEKLQDFYRLYPDKPKPEWFKQYVSV